MVIKSIDSSIGESSSQNLTISARWNIVVSICLLKKGLFLYYVKLLLASTQVLKSFCSGDKVAKILFVT